MREALANCFDVKADLDQSAVVEDFAAVKHERRLQHRIVHALIIVLLWKIFREHSLETSPRKRNVERLTANWSHSVQTTRACAPLAASYGSSWTLTQQSPLSSWSKSRSICARSTCNSWRVVKQSDVSEVVKKKLLLDRRYADRRPLRADAWPRK